MIASAAIRSQIAQFDSFNSAINVFKNKYNALPGDMKPAIAAANGFATRTGAAGYGDSNGLIQGGNVGAATNTPFNNSAPTGEGLLVWNDLSTAGLIEGKYTGDGSTNSWASNCNNLTPDATLPKAKIAGNIIIITADYVESQHYFQMLGGVTAFGTLGQYTGLKGGLTPIQAQNIDVKIDDGRPLTGTVQARDIAGFTTPWGQIPAAATPAAPNNGVCVSNANSEYNTSPSTGGDSLACAIRVPLSLL